MLNQVVLVGRIENMETVDEVTTITIIVPRAYKNVDGNYDSDHIPVQITGNMATNTLQYCKVADIIGIRGALRNVGISDRIELVADKVTFLSSHNPSVSEDEPNIEIE